MSASGCRASVSFRRARSLAASISTASWKRSPKPLATSTVKHTPGGREAPGSVSIESGVIEESCMARPLKVSAARRAGAAAGVPMTEWPPVRLIAGLLLSAVMLAVPAAAADGESAQGVALPSGIDAAAEDAGGDQHDDHAADHGDAAELGKRGSDEDDSRHGHGRAHRNEIGLFMGGTDERGHDTEFTWGLDYKRKIARRWAVGLLFDYAGGELRNSLLAPSVSFWPGIGGLQLLAAPGIEFHEGRNGGGHGGAKSGDEVDADATYFLFRVGLAYDIHLDKRFGLVPGVNLDFVNGEQVWVYGLTLTYGF